MTPLSAALLHQTLVSAAIAGWATLDTGTDPELIADVVRELGTPLQSRDGRAGIERLVPHRLVEAPRNSLSSRHGLGSFPFHSDAAHWVSPPRWVVMWCEADDEGRTTRLLPWRSILQRACSDWPATFLVRNGRRSFFVDVYEKARLDGGCMIPQNAPARSFLELANSNGHSTEEIELTWRRGLVLIIDNSAMLHARGEIGRNAVPDRRVLWRALFDEVAI